MGTYENLTCWGDEVLTLCFDRLCFRFVDSESALGLTLSCTSVQLFRALVLSGQANLHITSLK